jgi:hypothetical protein
VIPYRESAMKKVLLAGLLCVAWAVQAYALEDVSSKVQVIKGAPTFNYVTNQTSVSISVKNISNENLQIPVRVALISVTPTGIACANPNGVDSSGKPFFLLTLGAATELKPGETSNVKLILFSNPNRLRFNFMTNSYISTPENTIGNFIAAIELGDVDLAIKEMDDYAVKKYGSAFNLLVFDNPGFIKDFANKTLVKITDVMAKYELKVLENGVEIIYDVYLYKNSKGEWKIYKM